MDKSHQNTMIVIEEVPPNFTDSNLHALQAQIFDN